MSVVLRWVAETATGHDLAVHADIFGTDSLETIRSFGVDGFNIHTADISNDQLFETIATTGSPVFLSVGGSSLPELRRAISVLNNEDCEPAALIYGFQRYPTAFSDTHLRKIQAPSEPFDYPIGFAPHIGRGSE